jgi:hypothetical protein
METTNLILRISQVIKHQVWINHHYWILHYCVIMKYLSGLRLCLRWSWMCTVLFGVFFLIQIFQLGTITLIISHVWQIIVSIGFRFSDLLGDGVFFWFAHHFLIYFYLRRLFTALKDRCVFTYWGTTIRFLLI